MRPVSNENEEADTPPTTNACAIYSRRLLPPSTDIAIKEWSCEGLVEDPPRPFLPLFWAAHVRCDVFYGGAVVRGLSRLIAQEGEDMLPDDKIIPDNGKNT